MLVLQNHLIAVPAAAGPAYRSECVHPEARTQVVRSLKNDLVFSTLFVRSAG